MVSFPPCKINLGLHILAKRADGYHEIETCFYPVPWTDVLEIIPATQMHFTTSGLSIPGASENNLCLQAYALLKQNFNLQPVSIHLHKVLPTGAGLGGGSSDAAHTLRLLNLIFDLKLSTEKLQQYAVRLGSDCSFFMEDKPMVGTGRGEILNEVEVNLSGKFIVLVNPHIHVSTAEAYAGIKPTVHSISVKEIMSRGDLTKWKAELKNDFEETVLKKYPAIADVKEKLYHHGAVYAAMSGSGATVFGIFEKPINLQNQFHGMMYWSNLL